MLFPSLKILSINKLAQKKIKVSEDDIPFYSRQLFNDFMGTFKYCYTNKHLQFIKHLLNNVPCNDISKLLTYISKHVYIEVLVYVVSNISLHEELNLNERCINTIISTDNPHYFDIIYNVCLKNKTSNSKFVYLKYMLDNDKFNTAKVMLNHWRSFINGEYAFVLTLYKLINKNQLDLIKILNPTSNLVNRDYIIYGILEEINDVKVFEYFMSLITKQQFTLQMLYKLLNGHCNIDIIKYLQNNNYFPTPLFNIEFNSVMNLKNINNMTIIHYLHTNNLINLTFNIKRLYNVISPYYISETIINYLDSINTFFPQYNILTNDIIMKYMSKYSPVYCKIGQKILINMI